MTPIKSIFDSANGAMVDSVFSSESSYPITVSGLKKVNNLNNFLFGQFSSSAGLSSCVSAFIHAVSLVIFLCTKKQVPHKNASRAIAVVKAAKSIWNWPSIQNPRRPVSRYRFRYSNSSANLSISKPSDYSLPQPAPVCLFDFSPKPFRKAGRKSLRLQVLRGKFRSLSNHILLCHAPDCFSNAGAILLKSLTQKPGGQGW